MRARTESGRLPRPREIPRPRNERNVGARSSALPSSTPSRVFKGVRDCGESRVSPVVGKSTARFPAIGNPRGDANDGIAERHSAVSSGFCTAAGNERGPHEEKERTRAPRRASGP